MSEPDSFVLSLAHRAYKNKIQNEFKFSHKCVALLELIFKSIA